MEMAVIIFLMLFSWFMLSIRNFALTRIMASFILLYIGLMGTTQGVTVSYSLSLVPLVAPYTIMYGYFAGNTLALVFLLTTIFGAIGLLAKDAGD